MGVCTSYTTAWKYLRNLTTEARYLDMIRSGHWIWVYDNLNLQQHIRHEREGTVSCNTYTSSLKVYMYNLYDHITDCHSSMMNVTSRLAIKIRYLPDFDFSWSDKAPQRPRESVTIEDVSPSESDAQVLKQHAIHFIMEFLVTTFSSLQDLEKLIPTVEPVHPVQKTDVVPMKLLLKDEKYTSETIDILSQLYNDANLSGDHQVC